MLVTELHLSRLSVILVYLLCFIIFCRQLCFDQEAVLPIFFFGVSILKRQCHVMETKFFRNDNFAVFVIGHIAEIFNYLSQNKGVILKMDC